MNSGPNTRRAVHYWAVTIFRVVLTAVHVKHGGGPELLNSLVYCHVIGKHLITDHEFQAMPGAVQPVSACGGEHVVRAFITHIIVTTAGVFILGMAVASTY